MLKSLMEALLDTISPDSDTIPLVTQVEDADLHPYKMSPVLG